MKEKYAGHSVFALTAVCRVLLIALVVAGTGCTTAELKQLSVDDAAEAHFHYVQVEVELSEPGDRTSLMNRFLRESEKYDLHLLPAAQAGDLPAEHDVEVARLRVVELDRRVVNGEHHQSYGRRSLTQMRGRKKHEQPVITLRATLTASGAERPLFQADYVTQGPWHADSASLVAALAGSVLDQLERASFIVRDLDKH